MVKLMMQDAMFTLTYKSCNHFVNELNNFIPDEVEIKGPKEVSNTFELTEEQLEIDPEYARNNPPIPLIALDIL
jgi:hypothetical protein